MIDLKPIQERIEQTKTLIAGQESVLAALQLEIGQINTQRSSISDPELVDSIFNETDIRLAEIDRDRAKAKAKLGILQTTLANAEQELENSVEANRLEKYDCFEKEIIALVKEANKASEAYQEAINKINRKVCDAHKEVYKHTDKTSRFCTYEKVSTGVPKAEMFIYDFSRREVRVIHQQIFDQEINKYERAGIDYEI